MVQVNKLEDTRWSVTTLSKESTLQLHECHHLFLCAPFPQSFELIKHILTQKETAELTKCRYTKCIVMMFVVDEREVAFINKYGHEVEKMVIGVGSLVVHMTHAFSLSNYTKSNLELEEMILDRVDPVLRDKPKSLKKWGFARPEVCLKGSFWRSRRLQGLSLSGDYFQQVESNVETSIMSAQYAAMDYLTRRN